MTFLLDGVALVTGAGSGIGRHCALSFAKEGACGVVFADIDEDAVITAAEESKQIAVHPGYQAIAVKVDVTNEESVEAMVYTAVKGFGRLDYAFNSAGVGVREPAEIADASQSEFRRFMDVNVVGTFLCLKVQSKVMKEQNPKTGDQGGVIINMGSAAAHTATPMLTQYTTSKHAVLGLTRSAALDNAKYGIRVVSVSPSWVDTPMLSKALVANPILGEIIEHAVPMKRIARVEEVSDVVMFLASKKASYVTGSDWVVDGGTLLSAQ